MYLFIYFMTIVENIKYNDFHHSLTGALDSLSQPLSLYFLFSVKGFTKVLIGTICP